MKRDADDVRKIDGKFTRGWAIAQAVTLILMGVVLVGVFLGHALILYSSFAVLLVMAIVGQTIRTRTRRQQRQLREEERQLRENEEKEKVI